MTTLVSFGASLPRATARTALASLAFLLALPAAAAAQTPIEAPGEAPYHAPRPGFSLFGNADLAGTGMRVSGGMRWGVSNIGPCADGTVLFAQNGCGSMVATGNSTFEVVLRAGAPIHDFRKIRAVHPEINNHLGPQGYTQLSSHLRIGAGSQDWGPADNTLGTLFSGVVSTDDGSCQDNSGSPNNFMRTGFSLLAGSDCPPTWPSGGFKGPRVLNDSAFIRLQQAQGDDFTFDYWKVPESDRSESFLGSFSTYGTITDHYAEALTSYGSVTPRGGVARPARQGFPLGLRIHFEAFTFNRPQISNVVFWQALVINRSEDVYGVGIDYDSLYMGISNGMLLAGDQSPSMYGEPQRNAFIAVRNGVNIGCNGATPGVPAFCQNQGFRNTHGYAAIMLKSPIGDTRNKLLTRPGPFFNPTSRFADDTITFNHLHFCGFGAACFNSTIGTNDRRAFGHISSTEVNALDGRDPAGLTAAEQWGTFRPKAHPAQPNARFNRYVPGSTWSYDNKPFREASPGVPDTLFYDTCEGEGFIERNGRLLPSCSVTFSDTMPGKQVNAGPGNVGQAMTAGPFPLKAGDTTSFIVAWVAERDSAGFEAMINATIDAYLNYYLGPDAPPVPRIVSVEVASAEERFNESVALDPFVRLVFSDEPETFVDPFFARYASDLRTSTDPFFTRLRTFNPGLAARVEEIAQNNFSELWIFKSCDGGTTYTSDADCDGDPTIGPRGPAGLGWRPYAILRADANGNIPNTFVDGSVIPGVTYLYSLVTRSRGLTLAINDVDPATCPPPYTGSTGCTPFQRILTVADTASSTILSSGPSTATVYVPVSLPAGGVPSSFVATTLSGNATVPLSVTVSANARSGEYRLVFGNRFIINEITDIPTGAITTTVQVQEIVPSAFVSGPDTTATNVVVKETVLSGPGRIDVAGFTFAPSDTVIGTKRFRTQTITLTAPAVGFALAQGNRPFFVSTNLTNSTTSPTTPEGFTARSDFPGFRLFITQSDTSNLAYERLLRPNGDSIATLLLNANAVQFRQETSTRRQGRGVYEFRYRGDPFGPGVPFNPLGTAEQVGPQVRASLAARPVAATGDTTAAIRAIVAANAPAGYGPALQPIRFPFTVVSGSGNQVILAAPRRTIVSGVTHTLLIGNGADTIRVAVDSLDWLPGDPFVVLEVVTRDSLVGGRVAVGADGQRLTQTDTVVAFAPAVLGCNTPRERCNPAAFPGPGGTGYLPVGDGWKLVINYPAPFTAGSEVALRIGGGDQAISLARSNLDKIRVVPNPYVVQSFYDDIGAERRGDPRLLFTGVPSQGSLRIYSLSGQFLQELTWQQGDLNGNGVSGDLPWNLRTREGTQVAGGLYIYVLTANDAEGKKINARGKFVIIR